MDWLGQNILQISQNWFYLQFTFTHDLIPTKNFVRGPDFPLSINSINFRRRERVVDPIGSCNNVATILLQIYFIAFLEQESDNKKIFDNEPHLSKGVYFCWNVLVNLNKLGPLWQINCFQNDKYTSKASNECVLKCTSDLKLIRITWGSNIRESNQTLWFQTFW